MNQLINAVRGFRTLFVVATGSSDRSRWEKSESFRTNWKHRNAAIAARVAAKSSVLDLGCGEMFLREFLPADCRYQPVDLVSRSPETIVCDFNNKELPPPARYDYVVCSGLLEYIHDVDWFVNNIVRYGRHFVVTYCSREQYPDRWFRLRNGWVNGFSADEVVALFVRAGVKLRFHTEVELQHLFEFVAADADSNV